MNKPNVLLVDDNKNLCKTMSFVLERKGYNVQIAEDGGTAISKVNEQTYDVIFMDIIMPNMDGVETYRNIKKIKPQISVVMMTAYAVSDKVQEALQEGAKGVMYKPFDMDEVLKQLEDLVSLNKRSVRRQPVIT